MNNPSAVTSLSREEILASLVSLGEDPTAARVKALHAGIDAATLPAGERVDVVRAAVDAARFELDTAGPNSGDVPLYQPGMKYSGKIADVKYLPVSAIERQEMDFRPEVMVVSDEVANSMDFSEPVEVTAFRFGKDNDDTLPVVTLRDGHHRTAAAIQTKRAYLPVDVKAINAKGEKLNALIALSRAIEVRLIGEHRRDDPSPEM
ncbi:hypothetical protein R70006_05048 [Paraburkholderia domus]|uniref:hypothetical protein n=1 Tax=Paraburkholderia domus TaxID=2793075 RepID=UPI001914C26A|nr:hypothetical protein [Paraburkholderia domus]MBK5051715.1 hypothetical protein [Burkholderia sp. R-70006]CAE6795378.1 hypothetical protein R70006_05048 [Paraburkholderia domus]